ncbi:MAG: glutamine synthetase, partial [Planctomycetota bacterium]
DNNRSVAFRIPPGDDANQRIEHRVSGAEANPYLVLAAVLAGIHHGLVNKLDPGEKHQGNAGAAVDENLPLSLPEAISRMQQAAVLTDYLGHEYLEIYSRVKQAEYDAFMADLFDREHQWYL